jgi:DNA-binding transcriptional MerR regulator
MSVDESPELLFDVGSEKLLTIGSVVDRLRGEFPDISVSKLRYLEEQGLIAPQRTKSGYRLFSEEDFRRLVRVLAMQRDEYLPLKVIRRELERRPGEQLAHARQGLRKVDFVAPDEGREFTAEELLRATGADGALLAELEEYELVRGRQVSGVRRYGETDAGIVGAAVELARNGLRPKNLRLLKSAVDREAGLFEQLLLPSLRSHREDRRREALDQLEEIVQATTQLRQLLLTRTIRRMTGGEPHRQPGV